MLIAENWERRGVAETDQIKVARIASFLEDYWKQQREKIRHYGGKKKTVEDVADFIGESKRVTERLLKLNDLIPQIQKLVSSGKLGTTSAEQLAYLTPEVQTAF